MGWQMKAMDPLAIAYTPEQIEAFIQLGIRRCREYEARENAKETARSQKYIDGCQAHIDRCVSDIAAKKQKLQQYHARLQQMLAGPATVPGRVMEKGKLKPKRFIPRGDPAYETSRQFLVQMYQTQIGRVHAAIVNAEASIAKTQQHIVRSRAYILTLTD